MKRWLLPLEIAAWLAIGVADIYGFIPLSRTPFLFALGWISLRLRGCRWRDAGLARPPRWPRAIVIGVVLGIAMEIVSTFVTVPLFTRVTGRPPELSEFRFVVGNVRALMLMLLANWILAAFGEEMAYRGYVLSRIADAVRGNWIVALVVGSIYFGWGHEAQHITGIIQESVAGLVLGIAYVANRRNLTVPIIAHGVSNTVAFILIYFNCYPGV
jgi:membrane protease YdiL (CAAX protease family)